MEENESESTHIRYLQTLQHNKEKINSTAACNAVTTKLSKSSQMLMELFGENQLILEYDQTSKKIKNNMGGDKIEYKKILDQLEVQIKNLSEKLQEDLNNLEKQQVSINESTDLIPKILSEKTNYDNVLKKLCYIQALKREFNV